MRAEGVSISEHDIDLTLQRGGGRGLSIHVAPFGDESGAAVLSFHAQHAARNMERQLSHRSAARSVSAMAAMLAHEVKNPLSGIRGAAQLLERVVTGADQELARLIRGETDRICALVDRMGGFVADGPLDRTAVNIHEVLERVQRSAEAGFARHVEFSSDYDPSLPAVVGNRDQLIQIFLNLVKNAAEAVSQSNGVITLKTGFRRGVRLAVSGSEGRVHLPLMITVSDNGPGMSDEIARHLFDPFIRNGNHQWQMNPPFAAGFARHVEFSSDYDPSLPAVVGNRDQLIQIFLNLVKNAAEAVSQSNGVITLKTGFRRGVRLAVSGSEGRVHLPLMITVSDNGPGMSDEIARHLFDPFITTKSGGTGLGLALVAPFRAPREY